MKNIIVKSFVLAAVAVLSASCIKETFPQGSTVTQAQLSESTDALSAMLNSIPSSMTSANAAGYMSSYSSQFDFGIPAIHMATDSMCEDIAVMGSNPGYYWFGAWIGDNNQGERYIYCAYFWDCYYPWIKTCNDIIGTVKVALAEEKATDDQKDILGKAYAYRAKFYLDLARLYEAKENLYIPVPEHIVGLTAPIVTDETTEKDGFNNPRAKKEDMYKFILDDLTKAAEYISPESTSYLQPSLAVVNGLFARTYIELAADGDAEAAQLAIDYADAVIDASYTPLTEAKWSDPKTGFNDGMSAGWVWGVSQSAENSSNLVSFMAHISAEASWGYVPGYSYAGINKALYDQISEKDFRKYSYLDPDMMDYHPYKLLAEKEFLSGTGAFGGAPAIPYESIKFRPKNGNYSDYVEGNLVDIPLMRVEEMYLLKAEAQVYANKLGDAVTTINDFMKYRITDGSYACAATGRQGILDEILLQKRIEFWAEGIVMYDYKRMNHGFTRGYEGTNHAGVHRYNCNGRSPQWNIVITRGETQANKGIPESFNNPDPTSFTELWVEE